jgi:putative transposase
VIESLHKQASDYSVSESCRALGVSRSGLYAQRNKPKRVRCLQDQKLRDQIGEVFAQSRATYGSRRVQQALAHQGQHCGRKRILRLMDELELKLVQKRRFRPRTTQSRHREPIAPNRLRQLLELPSAPNQIWCADLTYLPSKEEGWLYLAAILDLCSRRLVGWKLSTSLAAPLVTKAFERALKLWPLAPQIHHSDRGVQYASSSFQKLLSSHQVLPSMSRKGCCYDNAAMESFWATLKTECFAHQIPLNLKHAQAMLFDYIETFYNPQRLHSALGYRSPLQFENLLLSQQPNQT